MAAKKKPVKAKQKTTALRFVGDRVELLPIDRFKPNDWNINEVTPDERASIRESLKTDGWALSQAMLVWGTDEHGKRQDVIVDGQHRWEEARKLGFEQAPVVFLREAPRREAIAWTVRLRKARGSRLDQRKTARVLDAEFGLFAGLEVRERETLQVALRLGFAPDEVDALRLKLPGATQQNARQRGDAYEPAKAAKCPTCGRTVRAP